MHKKKVNHRQSKYAFRVCKIVPEFVREANCAQREEGLELLRAVVKLRHVAVGHRALSLGAHDHGTPLLVVPPPGKKLRIQMVCRFDTVGLMFARSNT